MNFIAVFVGTFAYCGFFPIAPATFASFVFCLIYAFVPGGHALALPAVALATLIVSVPVSTHLEKRYGHDSGRIVIDEVVGMQAILVFAEPTLAGVVLAFFLFRFFDIVKVFPANRAQHLPRGYGVVADDFLAGIYARIALIIVALVFPAIGRFGL